MAYTPPLGDNVNFTFSDNYTPPAGNDVDFTFGIIPVVTIESISTNDIFDDALHPGFNSSIIKWSSSVDGPYRVEVGGSGANTGYLTASGTALSDITMTTVITDSDIEAVTSFSGTGSYRFNIYVQSIDDIWSIYE